MNKQVASLRTVAVISAAGRGTRMGLAKNKVLLSLDGRPVLQHTLEALQRVTAIDAFIVVVRREEEMEIRESIIKKVFANDARPFWLCYGGATRESSMWSGLMALPESCEVVLYHDGARPFLRPEIAEAALARLAQGGVDGVVAAVPVKDTIKVCRRGDFVEMTPVRDHLRAAQTPQVFLREAIVRAYERARQEAVAVTDDAQILEISGGTIAMIPGDYGNIKITTPEDLAYGEWVLKQRGAKP